MFSEIAEIALVAARLGQFMQFLKTRVILNLNFTRPHAITHTKLSLLVVSLPAAGNSAQLSLPPTECHKASRLDFRRSLESSLKSAGSFPEQRLVIQPKRPGARFSKAPKTFRAWEPIFNCLYIENKEGYRQETLHEGKLCSY